LIEVIKQKEWHQKAALLIHFHREKQDQQPAANLTKKQSQ
jgi:hypothetical protein